MSTSRTISPFLKLALDLGPLLIFFAANSMFDIYVATGAFMVAMIASIGIGFSLERKISPMPLITLALVLVFGGLTLWLANDLFIKLKPTILYVIFAAVLIGGLASKRLFIKILLGQTVHMPDAAWRVLTWRWAIFFLALAAANEFVRLTFSTDTWVAFKVWGVFPATMIFALAQTPFLMRHQTDDKSPAA
jgi:intracellular septation protein